jgi:hypothetical protein
MGREGIEWAVSYKSDMGRRMKILLSMYLAFMAVMHIFILIYFSDFTLKGYNDFAAFYTAGTIVKEGQTRRLYDPSLQWKIQEEFAPEVGIRKGPLPYIHPPFEAYLFWVLAQTSYAKAYVVWTVFKFAALVLAIFLLIPTEKFGVLHALFLAVLSLGLFPVAVDLLQGQDSILLLLIFSLCFFLLMRKMEFWAGSILALGLLKFHLVLPVVLIFLLRKRLKFVSGFSLAGMLLLLLSIVMVGWESALHYPKYIWALDHAPGFGVTTWENMPNVRGILTSAFGRTAFVKFIPEAVFAAGIIGVISAAMFGKNGTNQSVNLPAVFSLAIVTSLFTSYYAYGYEMVLLLIPILLLGASTMSDPKYANSPKMFFIAAAALLIFSPAGWYLVLRTQNFCWYGSCVLALFAAALIGIVQRNKVCTKVVAAI